MGLLPAGGSNTSVTMSDHLSARIHSNLRPPSHEIISASVLVCETAVLFLQDQPIGTHVLLSKMHNIPSDVHLESARSPAKSASWKRPSLHSDAVLPT